MRANLSALSTLTVAALLSAAGSAIAAPVIVTPLPDVAVRKNAGPTNIDMLGRYSDPGTTVVRFATNLGNIDVCLFDAAKPITVGNFKNYMNSGAYNNSIFHRSARYSGPGNVPFIIQGGGFKLPTANNEAPDDITANPAIQNEPGISNTRGTIAMAKLGGSPNSATCQWFFNLHDRNGADPTGAMLDTQNGGFTVFGRVVNGMSVLDSMMTYTAYQAGNFYSNGALNELPLIAPVTSPEVVIEPADFLAVTSMTQISGIPTVTMTATSADPTLVTTAVNGTLLKLTYASNKSGRTNITITVKSQDGSTNTDVFAVVIKCSPADIANDQGQPLPGNSDVPNGGVNEGDYNLFFTGFFDAASYCNIADDQGNPLPSAQPNNGVNEGDYNCFFQRFFDGCE